MTNDAILVQHVSENYEGANLYKLTAPINIGYCLKHRMDYELLISEPVVQGGGDWVKINIIRSAMEMPYKYVIWLDADTLIVDTDHDLRQACQDGKVGACIHKLTNPPYTVNYTHFNIGAMYIENCDITKKFMEEWMAGYPGKPPWGEQGVFNDMAESGDVIVEVDAKYNATGQVNPSPNPVVLGFHGQGKGIKDRFELMLRAAGK